MATPSSSSAVELGRGDRVLTAFLGLGIASFIITYILSLSVDKRVLRPPFLFLSESINNPPSSCFGSFLLSPASAAFAVVVILRHEQIRSVCVPPRVRWVGLVAALAGHGVASFQLDNWALAHFAFAYCFFVGSTVYLVVSAWHERAKSLPARAPRLAAVRQFCACLAPVLLIYTMAVGPLLLVCIVGDLAAYNEDEASGSTRSTSEFAVVLSLSVTEVLMYANFALFFATLSEELRWVRMSLSVHRAPPAEGPATSSLSEPFINYIAPDPGESM